MLKIVDTHVHLFDLTHKDLIWSWLAPDAEEGRLGNIDGIKSLRYEAENLIAESRFAAVDKFVHIQAAIGSKDPVLETKWLTQMFAQTGVPAAIVGHVDLTLESARKVIDQHLQYANFRGVRDFAVEGALISGGSNKELNSALNYLAENNLVLDLDCQWPNMNLAAELARQHPLLKIVIEHIGIPISTSDAYFVNWKMGMQALASEPNIFCKISGVGMFDPRFTETSIRPWIEHCISIFGPDRCMIGSNWPLDRLFSSYDAVFNIYRKIIAQYSEEEQVAISSATANSIYRI
jgi:predicted TIM-barrel fold metal-dependent hydrolase